MLRPWSVRIAPPCHRFLLDLLSSPACPRPSPVPHTDTALVSRSPPLTLLALPPALTLMDSSVILNNLRTAYAELLRRVNTALRTQVGDAPRLREVRAQALALRAAAEQVSRSHRMSYVTPLTSR